jgi:hypothetical protein
MVQHPSERIRMVGRDSQLTNKAYLVTSKMSPSFPRLGTQLNRLHKGQGVAT